MEKKVKLLHTKLLTLFMSIIFVSGLFVLAYEGFFEFQNKDLGNLLTLFDLKNPIYGLILSGIILNTISLLLFFIGTIFGRLLETYNKYLWGASLFFLLIGIILIVGGEGYFAATTEKFTETFKQTTFIGITSGIIAVGLCIFALGMIDIWDFIKKEGKIKQKTRTKNIDLENKIEVKQVNPKFRLCLLIFGNWFIIIYIILWPILCNLVPALSGNIYIGIIGYLGFVPFLFVFVNLTAGVGIEYLSKDLCEYYVNKNYDQLKKIKNLEIKDITQLFDVIPICDEVYLVDQSFDERTEEEFVRLSFTEEIQNRLVLNGKIKNLDFSWGVVTKAKKNSLKTFLLSVLCYGPIGIFIGLTTSKFANINLSDSCYLAEWAKKHKKLGTLDLFPAMVGKLNSENYLIFAAKLENWSDLITLVPKNNASQFKDFDSQYEWPTSLSNVQKNELQTLIKKIPFLPSIYLYGDSISIVMKKYDYNSQDNQELQTWELIKDKESNNEIQFNYLNNAIKIYQILNSNN